MPLGPARSAAPTPAALRLAAVRLLLTAEAAKPNCRTANLCSCRGGACTWVAGLAGSCCRMKSKLGWLASPGQGRGATRGLTWDAADEPAAGRTAPLRHACCAVNAKQRSEPVAAVRPSERQAAASSPPPAAACAANTSPTPPACSERCSRRCTPRMGVMSGGAARAGRLWRAACCCAACLLPGPFAVLQQQCLLYAVERRTPGFCDQQTAGMVPEGTQPIATAPQHGLAARPISDQKNYSIHACIQQQETV